MSRPRASAGVALVAVLACVMCPRPAAGQAGAITGTVRDSASRIPLSGVMLTALDGAGGVGATAVTDGRGRFRLTGLAQSGYTLLLRRIGYVPRSLDGIRPHGSGPRLELLLIRKEVVLDPLQVTASRSQELALDAPASVSVVDRGRVTEMAALTPLDRIRTVTGVDFASKGLLQHTFAARGPRGATNGAVLLLMDDRRAALPALGVNIAYFLPNTINDLERIEVVRGPGAALYGPGATRGVVQIITRSPFESPGTAFSVAAGERDLFQGTARLAAVVSPHLAFKLSGDWVQGHDWEHYDSVEARLRRNAIARNADLDTLLVGRRDFRLRRAAGEARIDWRIDDATTLTGSVGAAEAISVVDQSALGGVQVRNWRYSHAQARLWHGRLFANVAFNLSDAGGTYLLRTGLPLVDNSRQTTAQLQHSREAGPLGLLYGLDGRWTDPRTGGTIHGRNEEDDLVAEQGGYVQARAAASPMLDLIGALRVDHSNRLHDLVVSPRVAAMLKPAPGHALRLTYNRAFTAPDATNFFLDVPVAGWPFPVRQSAIPRNGFSFRRDCGGLCMRSSLNPAGADQYLAADATLLWSSIVTALGQTGEDIADIPAPTSSQVATQFAALDPASMRAPRFIATTASAVVDLPPRGRGINQTLEFGYKGVVGGRVLLTVDGYVTRLEDPIGPLFTATPSVFFDSASLAAYLAGFRTPQEAARLGGLIGAIRVGNVSPREAYDPQEILLVRRQGGGYTLWGADVSVTVVVGGQVEMTGTYSWLSRNVVSDIPEIGAVNLTAPRNKGAVGLRYQGERPRLTALLEGRAVGGFLPPGVNAEEIEPYAVLDAMVSYQLPWTARVSLSLNVSNLFDHRHREIGGAPELGRLVVSKLQIRL